MKRIIHTSYCFIKKNIKTDRKMQDGILRLGDLYNSYVTPSSRDLVEKK